MDNGAQRVIDAARSALRKSDAAIAASKALLNSLANAVKGAEAKNTKLQAKIDEEIKENVQTMDETMLKFVKALEE